MSDLERARIVAWLHSAGVALDDMWCWALTHEGGDALPLSEAAQAVHRALVLLGPESA